MYHNSFFFLCRLIFWLLLCCGLHCVLIASRSVPLPEFHIRHFCLHLAWSVLEINTCSSYHNVPKCHPKHIRQNTVSSKHKLSDKSFLVNCKINDVTLDVNCQITVAMSMGKFTVGISTVKLCIVHNLSNYSN